MYATIIDVRFTPTSGTSLAGFSGRFPKFNKRLAMHNRGHDSRERLLELAKTYRRAADQNAPPPQLSSQQTGKSSGRQAWPD